MTTKGMNLQDLGVLRRGLIESAYQRKCENEIKARWDAAAELRAKLGIN